MGTKLNLNHDIFEEVDDSIKEDVHGITCFIGKEQCFFFHIGGIHF